MFEIYVFMLFIIVVSLCFGMIFFIIFCMLLKCVVVFLICKLIGVLVWMDIWLLLMVGKKFWLINGIKVNDIMVKLRKFVRNNFWFVMVFVSICE